MDRTGTGNAVGPSLCGTESGILCSWAPPARRRAKREARAPGVFKSRPQALGFRSAWSVLTHLTGLLWRTSPSPTWRVAPTGTGLSRACSLLGRRRRSLQDHRSDRTEPVLAPSGAGESPSRGAAASQVQDMQNAAVDRSGLTEHRVAVRAIVHAVCSGASRGPPCRGACLRWVRRGIPGDPSPAPKSPGGIGVVRLEIRAAAAESPVAGATETSGDQRDPFTCCGTQQACLPGGPTGVILFPPCPSAVSISSVPFPSSTSLDTLPRQETAATPDPQLARRPWTSHVLCCSTVLLPPFRHPVIPRRLQSICCSEAAVTCFPHSIRNTKL